MGLYVSVHVSFICRLFLLILLRWHFSKGVGRATCYRLDSQSFNPSRGKIFLYCIASRMAVGPTQPPIQWVLGASPGVKQLGHEADHSPLFNPKVKNGRAIPPFPCMTS
jgi:hypothetical protein